MSALGPFALKRGVQCGRTSCTSS